MIKNQNFINNLANISHLNKKIEFNNVYYSFKDGFDLSINRENTRNFDNSSK